MLIGLSGYARVGKDSVAKILVEKFDFEHVAFATGLRLALLALDPIIGGDTYYPGTTHLSEALKRVESFEALKTSNYADEWRRLQQKMGTEVGRDMFGENVWVDLALKDYRPSEGNLVVSDMRFPNEYEAIHSRGGVCWRVERPGVGPANKHPSETSLDDFHFDRYIMNTGTLEDLVSKVIV